MALTGKFAAGFAALAAAAGGAASERGAPSADTRAWTRPADPLAPRPGLGDVEARLLAAHNHERALVGHPPLAWDPNLAAAAASYGPALARLERLVHSPRESRPGQAENLAMAWQGTHTPEQLVDMWIVEKRLLKPGLFPAVSRTGYWKDVGHYTQMVWRTTTHVGCAIHRAEWDYLICRYSPKGNIDGRAVLDPAASGATSVAARR